MPSKNSQIDNLTQGSLLARNTFLNIFGLCVPLLAALYSVPIIIEGVGTERFGLLTLAWAVVGYFSLFDLGLSRAIIHLVAEKLGSGLDKEVPSVIWTALLIMFCLGLAGTFISIPIVPYLVRDIFKCPGILEQETLSSFYLISASIPLVVIRSGFRGVLIAYQRFDLTNSVRIPLGIYTFLAPLLILRFSNNLFSIVCALILGLLVACIVYFVLCKRVVPDFTSKIIVKRQLILSLFRFGGWMTVTNIVSPILVYMDRFIIGNLVSLAAVAYYATPHEIITKIILIPSALTGVLFPAFSTSHLHDHKKLSLLFVKGVKYIFLIVFPVIVIFITFAQEGLTFWLGDEFAENSTTIFQLLSAGILFNCIALVPYSLIQGVGRPDITAKLHFLELPLYLVFLWWMISLKGAEGAAIAWVGRILLDTALLFFFARKLILSDGKHYNGNIVIAGIGLFLLIIGAILTETGAKVMFVSAFMICYPGVIWFKFIENDEKRILLDKLKVVFKKC